MRRMSSVGKGKKFKRRISNASGLLGMKNQNSLNVYDASGSVAASTTGSLTTLHQPTRGATNYNNRFGDSTTIRSFRAKISIAASATGTQQYVRVVLFWDNQPNGAVPGGVLPFTALTINALMDPQYDYRFKILKDARFKINGFGVACDEPTKVDLYLKKLCLTTNFTSDNGNISDIATGAMYLYIIGDQAVGATNANCAYYTRTTFNP